MKKIFASLLVSTLCISSASAVNPQEPMQTAAPSAVNPQEPMQTAAPSADPQGLTQVKGSREEATVVNSENGLDPETVAAKQQQQQKQRSKRRTWLTRCVLLVVVPMASSIIGVFISCYVISKFYLRCPLL